MILPPAELEFLRSQRIGRLATISPRGWPQVVPVSFVLDAEGADLALSFDVDGFKLRNLVVEPRVALVVDALGPKRGVSLQGRCELVAPERARLVPSHCFSWGL